MMLYNFVFFSLAFFSFIEKFTNIRWATKKLIVLFYSLLFIALSTLYAGRMGDRVSYEIFFDALSVDFLYHPFDGWFEYFYTVLAFLSKRIVNNYVFFRFVLALIVFWLWYKILCDKEYYYVEDNCLTILFILWSLHCGNIFIARSTIAITICVLSTKYIEKKDFKRFLLLLILAIGFHTLSVVWIASYFIYRYRSNKKLVIGTIIICLVTIFFPIIYSKIISMIIPVSIEYISRALKGYLAAGRDEMFGVVFDIRLTMIKAFANMFLLICLFLLISRREQYTMSDMNNGFRTVGYFNLYLLGTILYGVSLSVSIVLSRAALPYTIISVFLIPRIFDIPEFKKNMESRLMLFAIFFIYCFLRYHLNMLGADEFIIVDL